MLCMSVYLKPSEMPWLLSYCSWGSKYWHWKTYNYCWSWADCKGLCKQMESCHWAYAQWCDYFFQQFPVWYGHSKSCINSTSSLLYKAFRLYKEDKWWFYLEQGSCFSFIDNVWDQKILEDFLGHFSLFKSVLQSLEFVFTYKRISVDHHIVIHIL